jgi:hypothetical protein
MPAPVRVTFVPEGHQAVLAAFSSIAKKAQELSRLQAAEARKTVTIGRQAANDNVKASNDASKKQADQARQAQTIRANSAAMAGKLAVQAANAEAREAARTTKAVESEAKRRDKIRENSAKMAGRYAKQQADAEKRERDQAYREIQREDKSRGRAAAGVLGRGVRGGIGTIAGIGVGLGATGGVSLIQGALQEGLKLNRQAAQLSNTATLPGLAPPDPSQLVSRARGVAGQTGLKSTDVLSAMNVVAARAAQVGNLFGMSEFNKDLDDLAKTAIASGTAIEDMAGNYAAALQAGVRPGEEMKQVMLDLVQMGKMGNVEFKDMASELPKMAGMGKLLAQGGAPMVKEVLALSQFAVQQQVSPEEARTSVQHAIMEAAMKSDVLKKSGIDPTDKATGKLRSPTEIIAESMSAAYDPKRGIKFGRETKFGAGALATLYGARGMAIPNVMTDTFMKAGKGKEGAAAVVAEIRAMQGATMTSKQRDTEFDKIMATDAQKFDVAMESFKGKIAELLPQISKLIPTLLDMGEKFAKLAVWLGENPYKGVAAIIGASVAKEMAGAALGKVVESGIAGLLGRIGGGGGAGVGGLGGAAGGVGGAITGGALALAGGYVGGQFINETLQDPAEEGARLHKAKGMAAASLSYYRRKAAGGGLTEEDRARLQEHAGKVGEWKAEAGVREQGPSGLQALNPGAYLAQKAYMEGGGENAKSVSFDEIQKAMAELAATAKTASTNLATIQGGMANPGNPARGGVPPLAPVSH